MKYLLAFLISFGAFSMSGQSNFPTAWLGDWKGRLEIFNATGKVQDIPMELHLHPLDTVPAAWTYTIVYGEDRAAGTRAYQLIAADTAKGLYMLDEKNSIKMEAYLLGGKFFQSFEVEGTTIFSTTELVGGELWWELVSGTAEAVSTTGGHMVAGEEIPPVRTFPLRVVQRARLRRV